VVASKRGLCKSQYIPKFKKYKSTSYKLTKYDFFERNVKKANGVYPKILTRIKAALQNISWNSEKDMLVDDFLLDGC
jgi:hypothetical protein